MRLPHRALYLCQRNPADVYHRSAGFPFGSKLAPDGRTARIRDFPDDHRQYAGHSRCDFDGRTGCLGGSRLPFFFCTGKVAACPTFVSFIIGRYPFDRLRFLRDGCHGTDGSWVFRRQRQQRVYGGVIACHHDFADDYFCQRVGAFHGTGSLLRRRPRFGIDPRTYRGRDHGAGGFRRYLGVVCLGYRPRGR